MAIKFVDEKPGKGSGTNIMTDEVVSELKDNPNKWGLVQENVRTAQSVATWVKKNEGFSYTATNSGKQARDKNGKPVPDKDGKQVNGVDVYVSYNPEGKKS